MPVPVDFSRLYHGVFPGIHTGEEDRVTPQTLEAYEGAAGREAAWVYFSHNWFNGSEFPLEAARWIRDCRRIPFIRLMLRANDNQASGTRPDPDRVYSLESINAGRHDRELMSWGESARDFAYPVVVEYGTEVNGFWFRWNGLHNGRGQGPERFISAFRRIVRIIRDEAGARNVTWAFHVNDRDYPEPSGSNSWNRMENYYPGEDVVDWIGVSVYGAQEPKADADCEPFEPRFAEMYDRLVGKAPGKPVFLFEFGATAGHPNPGGDEQCRPEGWAEAALGAILNKRRYPMLCGFAWWNEGWPNDDAEPTEMRLQEIPQLAAVFRRRLTGNALILDRPL
jgi:hypothetical protein